MQLDRAQLATLAAILRHGSFDLAAAELRITQPAVSQRLRALEERIGTVLVHRGTPATPTPAGAQLARHAEEVGQLESLTLRRLGLEPSAARVRIAVNADSLATWVPQALALAQARMPDTTFALEVDDQEHSARWLRDGQVSAAITSDGKALRGCEAYPLGALRYVAAASPAFIARHFPDGVTGPALSRAPTLQFNEKDTLPASWLRQHAGPVPVPPAHRLPSAEAFTLAMRAGLGWGLNPEPMLAQDLAEGRLRQLRPDAVLDTPLYWQVSRIMAPALAPLTQAIRQVARAELIAA